MIPAKLSGAGWGQSPPLGKIRVLVVDDSVVARRVVSEALGSDPEVQVVGTASNGESALEAILRLKPDLITLDVEMPGINGLETVRRIRRTPGGPRVVMVSGISVNAAAVTLEALSSGADDYVTKPSGADLRIDSLSVLRADLLPKIKQFFRSAVALNPPRPAPAARFRVTRPRVVAIGVSTGGPNALTRLLGALPPDLPVPVMIVQHMPPLFTSSLARQLQAHSKLKVSEAEAGMALAPGSVYLAPGGLHMEVRKKGSGHEVALHSGPPENFCRPAVDVLFRSVQAAFGGEVLAVVLTGMGRDGLEGVRNLKASGAYVIVQDEASSVVWSMPGSVAAAGLADAVLGLADIAGAIARRSGGRA